jgi:hypothetical protein
MNGHDRHGRAAEPTRNGRSASGYKEFFASLAPWRSHYSGSRFGPAVCLYNAALGANVLNCRIGFVAGR